MRLNHDTYYRDRHSERDLCHDFPGDEILIDGLHAMQCHFWNNNIPIEIPVVRVMNTAHFMAAYMFTTTCSGDQLEYDALANMSLGCDKQLFKVAIIVLAAMLQRTDGFRAKACRNMLLENRSEDFEEGVSLYDQFLRSAEKRFSEEDFLMDTGIQIQRLQAEKQELQNQYNQLQYKYHLMEEQQNKPQPIVYNYGIYIAEQHNDIHDNPYSTIYTVQPSSSSVSPDSNSDSLSGAPGVRQEKESRLKPLFDDPQRATEECNRFLNFLSEHNLRSRLIDSSQDNPILKAIVCFCAKWRNLRYIALQYSPTAVVRFLTDTCALQTDHVAHRAIANALGVMIRNGYDSDLYYDVCEYF